MSNRFSLMFQNRRKRSTVFDDEKSVDNSESLQSLELQISGIHFPVVYKTGTKKGVGLEALKEAAHIIIRPDCLLAKDDKDYYEVIAQSRYFDVVDIEKGRLYYSWETDCNELGNETEFMYKIVDYSGRPVMQISNSTSSLHGCLRIFGCCGTTGCTMTVSQPSGRVLGILEQKYNGNTPKFNVFDDRENKVLTILGPQGAYCCCNCNLDSSMTLTVEFPIYTVKGAKVGSITKRSIDPLEHIDFFTLDFPQTMSIKLKAVLVAAVFGINHMFYDMPVTSNVVENYKEQYVEHQRKERYSHRMSDLEVLGLSELRSQRLADLADEEDDKKDDKNKKDPKKKK